MLEKYLKIIKYIMKIVMTKSFLGKPKTQFLLQN